VYENALIAMKTAKNDLLVQLLWNVFELTKVLITKLKLTIFVGVGKALAQYRFRLEVRLSKNPGHFFIEGQFVNYSVIFSLDIRKFRLQQNNIDEIFLTNQK